jgi:hypothetical protein
MEKINIFYIKLISSTLIIAQINRMKQTSDQLHKIASSFSEKLKAVDEEKYSFKPSLEKWSKKEVLGHLIDSAQTNIRRFVVAQYEDSPKIVYRQDEWVAISDYQNYETIVLIELWRLLNHHAAIILSNMTEVASKRKCDTNDKVNHSIEWLADDYMKHLLHHLHQILDLEPIAYP